MEGEVARNGAQDAVRGADAGGVRGGLERGGDAERARRDGVVTWQLAQPICAKSALPLALVTVSWGGGARNVMKVAKFATSS